jgi:hypothetical protein
VDENKPTSLEWRRFYLHEPNDGHELLQLTNERKLIESTHECSIKTIGAFRILELRQGFFRTKLGGKIE